MTKTWWVVLALVAGCGGDGHPDTGYGANTTIPAQVTCDGICSRLADCVVTLCNEDKRTDRFSGLESLFYDDCFDSCSDAQVQATLAEPKWSCLFTESCREVLEHDTCDAAASYTCN